MVFAISSIIREFITSFLFTSGSSAANLHSRQLFSHSAGAFHRNSRPLVYLLLVNNCSILSPLGASSAGFQLNGIYLHCETSVAPLIQADGLQAVIFATYALNLLSLFPIHFRTEVLSVLKHDVLSGRSISFRNIMSMRTLRTAAVISKQEIVTNFSEVTLAFPCSKGA